METIVAESKLTPRNANAVNRAVLCAQVAEDHKGKDCQDTQERPNNRRKCSIHLVLLSIS